MTQGIVQIAGTLAAPWMVLLYRLTKAKRFLDLALLFDPKCMWALESHAASIGATGTQLDQTRQTFILSCHLKPDAARRFLDLAARAASQMLQDAAALVLLEEKRNGYFVEVGVGDGIHISNTYLMEKEFGWRGLLIEPNKSFAESILENRKSPLVTHAAYNLSGKQLQFEAREAGEFSTLVGYAGAASRPQIIESYPVETEMLDDILSRHDAPRVIDFVSIDTEGSEYEILEGLDLNKWRVSIFAIEHNFDRSKLARITKLLGRQGYKRVLDGAFGYDAFFVHPELFAKLGAIIVS